MSDDVISEWFTAQELADRWKKSVETIERYCRTRKLLAKKLCDGQWRIHVSVVDQHERDGKPRRRPSARPASVINGSDPWGIYAEEPNALART